jgi:GntR family transcriptional regulator, transcriptional repressor for pyruvate dehydrogenase complex
MAKVDEGKPRLPQGDRSLRAGPARAEKVSSIVARRIAREIVEQDLEPGALLAPEATMMEEFGVSRASLREGLRILETLGLVAIRPGPGGGPSVADMDSGDFGRMATLYFQVMRVRLADVIESRLTIEPVMASLAATRHDPAMNDDLREVMRQHYETEDDAEWRAVTDRFHSLICSMSGNPLLNLLARALKDIYTERVSGLVFPEEKRDHVRATHEEITKAIEEGDAETAERLMRDHMRAYADFFADRYPGLMDELVDWR